MEKTALLALLGVGAFDAGNVALYFGALAKGPVRYTSPYDFMFSSTYLSPIGPPWSEITAYDLNTGEIKWRVPHGHVTAPAELGIPDDSGAHWPRGGLLATGGGLGGRHADAHAARDHVVEFLPLVAHQAAAEDHRRAGVDGLDGVVDIDQDASERLGLDRRHDHRTPEPPADDRDRGVPEALQARQGDQGHQVAHVQAVCRGIEAVVNGNLFPSQQLIHAFKAVVDQSSPL